MNNCCKPTKATTYPQSLNCPVNGKSYTGVKRKTLLHHITRPWHKVLSEQGYYFCSDPDCDVVYFGQDSTLIYSRELRTSVGQKSKDINSTVCYCFGITKKSAISDKNCRSFVIEQTKNSLCSCGTSNPSGLCCLKDFPHS